MAGGFPGKAFVFMKFEEGGGAFELRQSAKICCWAAPGREPLWNFLDCDAMTADATPRRY